MSQVSVGQGHLYRSVQPRNSWTILQASQSQTVSQVPDGAAFRPRDHRGRRAGGDARYTAQLMTEPPAW